MSITRVGFRIGSKTQGETPRGTKVYLVGSDTNIGDDIDQILDASQPGGIAVPDYDSNWGSGDTTLKVRDKIANALDEEEGSMEGYWWTVDVQFGVTSQQEGQQALDPADREWDWDVSPDKRDIQIDASLFDTSGYVYQTLDATDAADQMVNLADGNAFTNTAGEPPETGVTRIRSRQVISLVKYITKTGWASLGVTDRSDLDSYNDTVNLNDMTILDVAYSKWDLLMDSVSYMPTSENGFDRIKVTFRVIVDEEFQHVFTFLSAGYNEINQTTKRLKKVPGGDGVEATQPVLLDKDGIKIPEPVTAPFLKDPVFISGGAQPIKDWSSLNLPESIP